ncbi:MAG: type III-B CRISPR-associated protein Cas10/Cmr2, partial [Rhodocyclaceae bacterium]|nr:type III-B CRISPR-associated protein Cas10/Cmr2 [Rhodocyclaceae bacterium]
MNELAFWQQKLIQFFHDPPGKPFTGTAKTGKHSVVAQALFEAFQRFNTHDRRKLRYIYKSADWAAAGADRSMLYVPRGMSGLGTVRWPSAPVITHPLSAGCKLEIDLQARPAEAPEAEDGDAEDEHEAAADETRDPLKEQQEVSSKLSTLVPDWSDPAKLREGFITLWRRWREDLCERGGGTAYRGDALWEEMPAETRSPDHSIWDHLKVVTALAFMLPHKMYQAPRDEGSREPWMLRFTLGPVQEFIDHSRTSRDLWISSFLLADLAWHAMQVFVEAYGPDCIVYPDLRGNPRADCWLAEHHAIALGEGDRDARRNPSSFAAVLPNACVALVPRGGEDEEVLQPLEQLAAKAQDAVNARWQELAALVRAWFEKLEPEPGCPTFDAHCASIWERQQQQAPVRCAWSAVPWLHMGRIASAAHLRGPALPAQGEHGAVPGTPQAREDHAVLDARRRRLAAWIPKGVWAHYELAREAFARSRLDYHQMERGFDYALTHHMLGVRHTLRKASDTTPLQGEEGGEKCTLCGMREALCGGEPARARGLDGRRAQARAFWRHSKLDPDGSGGERLCAICATKRFLVVADKASADGKLGKFNRLWAGAAAESYEVADRDGEVRVPFPSTATIAAQGFLERVVTKPDYAQEVAALVQACRAAGLPRTSFPRALPRLAAAAHATKGVAAALLEYEAEDVVYPETADARREAELARGNADTDKYLKLRDVINKLMRKARDIKDPAQPRKQIAVVRMDGDSIGQLLLGTPGAIGARWRDVLHPKVVERLKDNNYLNQAGWASLIDSKRLMGPSLHAFVSRALGQFSHCIVPWVVEREFSGRLIYAGGDDLLCIVPADEALDLTARLQQL